MNISYGATDAGASSCVLLYDVYDKSYAGEPTTNLFSQPTVNSGFGIKPTDTGRAFYKLDYYQNISGQGTFSGNAPGPFNVSDSVYKYNFVSGQTDSTSNKHGFQINIIRGDTYSVSVDAYVSTGHPRTGSAPVLSLTPNLTGSFATVAKNYNFDSKGTWQSIQEKIFVPSVSSSTNQNATVFEISVAAKISGQHQFYGSGSAQGFNVGNNQGRNLSLYKGATYAFTQSNSSNINDEFYLSIGPSGAGSSVYSNGFSYYGNKGFDGYALFTVPYDAPALVYYSSRNASSSYFGGKINILGAYNSGNTGNSGNGGSSGSSGNSGNSGSNNVSESYSVCFDPTRSELSGSNLNGGYILYKNMQFEKNKPMFKGIVHPTKFTSSSRSAYGSLVDLSGNGNDSNLTNAMFDSSSFVSFGNKTNSLDGGVIDINLNYNQSKAFSIGSSKIQTYDFWFKQTASSFRKAYLMARSAGDSGGYFTENSGYPQLIYIQDKRVYFSFTSPSNTILSGYSDQAIELNNLYHVVVAINVNLATGLKAEVYVNGKLLNVSINSILSAPLGLAATNVKASVKTVGNTGNTSNSGFLSQTNQFYCVSAYDSYGESKASSIISVPVDSTKKSIQLSWKTVNNANGYYLYRSTASSFGNYSLLYDTRSQVTNTFLDENAPLKLGSPKSSPVYQYSFDPDVINLVDDQNAAICFGHYPLVSKLPYYFQGYIYRVAIYDSQFSPSQVSKNYSSFFSKYSNKDPKSINSMPRQKSVIYKKVKE